MRNSGYNGLQEEQGASEAALTGLKAITLLTFYSTGSTRRENADSGGSKGDRFPVQPCSGTCPVEVLSDSSNLPIEKLKNKAPTDSRGLQILAFPTKNILPNHALNLTVIETFYVVLQRSSPLHVPPGISETRIPIPIMTEVFLFQLSKSHPTAPSQFHSYNPSSFPFLPPTRAHNINT